MQRLIRCAEIGNKRFRKGDSNLKNVERKISEKFQDIRSICWMKTQLERKEKSSYQTRHPRSIAHVSREIFIFPKSKKLICANK